MLACARGSLRVGLHRPSVTGMGVDKACLGCEHRLLGYVLVGKRRLLVSAECGARCVHCSAGHSHIAPGRGKEVGGCLALRLLLVRHTEWARCRPWPRLSHEGVLHNAPAWGVLMPPSSGCAGAARRMREHAGAVETRGRITDEAPLPRRTCSPHSACRVSTCVAQVACRVFFSLWRAHACHAHSASMSGSSCTHRRVATRLGISSRMC